MNPRIRKSGPLAARLLLALLCTLIYGAGQPARPDDLMDDQGVGNVIDDLQQQANDAWWNKDWKFRRKITVDDPKLLEDTGKAILLAEPEPLLLYNTGRCSAKLADLRAVAADGQSIPCGVTNFGRDDDSSQIWFLPSRHENQKTLQIFLYYGNPAAQPTGDAMPDEGGMNGDPQFLNIGAEQLQPGAAAPAVEEGSFFHNLIVAEAESFAPESDADTALVKTVDLQWPDGASGEKYVTVSGSASKPVTLWRTVQVPEAGAWAVHVRYKNSAPGKNEPFTLLLGAQEIACGAAHGEGKFGWQSATAELPQGDLKLGLRFADPASADVVLLTRDPHYIPDARDIGGPPWMRFKVTNPNAPPFYVDFFCMYMTTTVNGPQGYTAGYLFKDRTVLPKRSEYPTPNHGVVLTSSIPPYLAKLPATPGNLLTCNEWSPWGQSWPRGSYTWYSEARFMAGGKGIPNKMHDLSCAAEFATRPDPSRVFHDATATTNDSNVFTIHMPPALDLATVRDHTVTFDEWAQQRFEIAKSLGFKGGEGPKQIVASTMAFARSPQEADMVLKTLDWIGLNTVTLGGQGFDTDPVQARSSLLGTWNFYRTEYKFFDHHFMTEDPTEVEQSITGVKTAKLNPVGQMPGLSYGQTVAKIIEAGIGSYYRTAAESAKKLLPWGFSHQHYNDLDDEIGPAVDGKTINTHPLFKGFFVEYLKAHDLQPAFFGAKTWDDVQAIDYTEMSKQEIDVAQVKADQDAANKKLEETSDVPLNEATDAGGSIVGGIDDSFKENDKKAKENAKKELLGLPVEVRPEPTLFEKRAYYWTQKFRSHYTALFYHYETAAVTKYWPAGIRACPNLQASPIQCGRMWDGGLNIWDFARENATSAIQMEDWHTSPVNVSFGMNIARAAARKVGQPLSALIVLTNPSQRIICDLAQNARYFLFYLYGPVQGDPAFAEDRETLRQIGVTMRQIARAEPDILAAKNRQCDTAVLVDNASETNSQYFDYPFDHDRMCVYAALGDQQIPVDVVGAEEVLEDGALSKYKVIYVCDPHVQVKVQEKLKQWVADGGTLWADYAGLARTEYDEPSHVMDEVFGLKDRGAILPYTIKGYAGKLPPGVTINIPKSDLFAPDTITDARYSAVVPDAAKTAGMGEPDYMVSTGKVLATFADGKPAIVRNTFGKGQAFLCGFIAGLTYGGQWAPHAYNFSRVARTDPATPLRGQLMTAVARAGGARQHVVIDDHMFWACVHDGPEQTVVYLINGGDRDLKEAPLQVTLLKAPKSVYLAGGRPVSFTMNGLTATVPITLTKDETDILVFKY